MNHRRAPLLSNRDLGVLRIEREYGGAPEALVAKLEAARETLGLDRGAYGLVLNGLIDDPAAYAHDPETLDRLRESRRHRV